MKRLITLLVLLFPALVHGQSAAPRVNYTTGNPPTACVPGHLVTNKTTGKVYLGNSIGGCTDVTGGGAGLAGSTGATDNAILRADGTGGATLQNSGLTITDAGVLNVAAGTGTAPSVQFTGGTLTGFSSQFADNIDISVAGGVITRISSGGNWRFGARSLGFSSDSSFSGTDVGLRSPSAGLLYVTDGTDASIAQRDLSARSYQVQGVAQIFRVTSDFTTAANTSLQAITGLSWTVPANTAMNIPFQCRLAYSQATGTAAVAFGIQDVTVAPTNLFATGTIYTSATVFAAANLPTLTTTTATAIVTGTPSAITTIWNAELNGMIEQPSNASTSAITIMVSTANSSNLVSVKRGSFCRIN